MLQVAAQQHAFHPPQRLMDRRHLGEYVRAIAALLDHVLQAAYLSFYAPQSQEESLRNLIFSSNVLLLFFQCHDSITIYPYPVFQQKN